MAKRRHFGMVYRRSRAWAIRVRRHGEADYCRQGFPTKELALAALAKVELALARGEVLGVQDTPRLTLADIRNAYMEHIGHRISDAGQVNARGMYARAEDSLPAPLTEWTRGTVEGFVTKLRAEGASPATGNRYLSLLSSVCKFAVSRGWLVANPCAGVARAREDERAIPYLTDADCAKIAAFLPPGYRAPAAFAAETGLRRGEQGRLQWGDVQGGAVVVRQSKTGRSRMVPLSARARAVLGELEASRGAAVHGAADPVFTVDLPTVARSFSLAAERAGYEGLRWHDLRHAFCSRLAQAGVPIPTIAALAGHADVQTTMRYAKHQPQDAARVAIEALDRRREAM